MCDAIRACNTTHNAHMARVVGVPSIHAELLGSGFSACPRTVGRHMHYLGSHAKGSQKFKRTTDSNHGKLVSPNLLECQFEVRIPIRFGLEILLICTLRKAGCVLPKEAAVIEFCTVALLLAGR
ncbi:hypothetical protein HC248_03285 [Polaromonas vacuolata]|uniref:Uncharacterized protein n=1 Tax=Polaromonas vacuolata TaxID=37448 RepID=A0A6H2HDT5_9BURK|nr:hypothetical protein HC248_03285 [Polaromonas vacuolata]